MTELAHYNGNTTPAVAQPEPAAQTGNQLIAWAESAVAANNIAQSLARTSFVPKAFQGKPDEVTAAILTGQEMGLSPMAALRSMNVIQGTAALSAISLRGLVQSKGHEIWTEESTATRAIVCGRRKGSEKIERVTWSMDRATKAGFVTKNPNYKSQPQNMLLARATAECARLIAADALLGMPYSSEELADENGTGETPKTRKVSRRKTGPAPTAPEPELTAPDPDQAAEDADPENEGDKAANAAVGTGSSPDPWANRPEQNDGSLWPEAAAPGSGTH